MKTFIGCCLALSISSFAMAQKPTTGGTAAPIEKVPTVAVGGCLKEGAKGTWMLVNASEPVASNPNAPPAKELATLPKSGKNEFQLIGVGIFNLPAHRGHNVLIKGLHIVDKPLSRLNMTSLTMVAETCPPPEAK